MYSKILLILIITTIHARSLPQLQYTSETTDNAQISLVNRKAHFTLLVKNTDALDHMLVDLSKYIYTNYGKSTSILNIHIDKSDTEDKDYWLRYRDL